MKNMMPIIEGITNPERTSSWWIPILTIGLVPVAQWLVLFPLNKQISATMSDGFARFFMAGNIMTLFFLVLFYYLFWMLYTGIIHTLALIVGGNGIWKQLAIWIGWTQLPLLLCTIGLALYSSYNPFSIAQSLLTDKVLFSNFLSGTILFKSMKGIYQGCNLLSVFMVVWAIHYMYKVNLWKSLVSVTVPICILAIINHLVK